MSLNFSMLNGIFSLITDFVTGIFAFIPQMMYFIYTCGASVIDFLQYVMRKLAGLDVYYVNGEAQTGDIILSIVKGIMGIGTDTSSNYSVLSTVFWSMIIFGVVILVLSTIIKMIITHYNYNPDESNPMTILRGTIKSLFTIALVPIVTIFGIEISNALLGALDQITAGSSNVTIATVYKNSKNDYKSVFASGQDSWGNTAYSSYDFFGSAAYMNNVSISGTLFTIAGNSANRVRHQSYTAHENGSGDGWSNFGIFTSSASDEDQRTEEVAYMIDYAFANCLTLQTSQTASIFGSESFTLISSFSYLHSAVWYLGTINFKSFSKFNVGLVWYYYNLWGFNWFIAIAGLSIALTLIINIVFGLITRLIMTLALFLVFPGVVGIKPLDGGNAQSQWRQEFVGNVLMAYGAILGMNLVFMVLPILQNITFFGGSIVSTLRSVPDLIMDMIIIIAALLTTKKIIQIFSNIIGAKDAQTEGAETKEMAQKAAFAAADKAMKAAKLGVKVAKAIYTAGGSLAIEAAKLAAKKIAIKEAKKKLAEKLNKKLKEKMKKKNKEDAEEKKKEDEKNAEDEVKSSEDATQTEATENESPESETEEDKLLGQGEELTNQLADGNFDASKFGSEADNAKDVKDWYDAELAKQTADINSREDLTDFQKQMQIGKVKKKLQSQATERFFFNSGYVGEEAKEVAKDTKISEVTKKELKKTGGKIKNSKVGKLTSRVYNGVKNTKNKLQDKGVIGKGTGKAIAEIAASSLTAIGEMSGLSGLKKALEDAKVFDSTYSTIREFGQAVGLAADSLPQDEEAKAKEEKEKGETEALNNRKVYVYSERVRKQMIEMKNLLDSMKK